MMCFSICSLYHIRYYEEMNPSYTGSRCFRILQVYEARKRKTHAGLGGNAILGFLTGKLGL